MRIPLLYYIVLMSQLCTAIVGGFRYKSLSLPLKILEWLFIISVVDTVGSWFLFSFHIHTFWPSHYYTLIELVFITMIYINWIKQQNKKTFFLLCLAGFTLLWIIGKFSFEPFSYSDDWTATISKILQIAFSVFILIEVMQESDILWMNDPRLWVAISIILYAAGTLFWFALFNKMLQISPERLRQSYSLNWILIIISNLFFIRSFLCKT